MGIVGVSCKKTWLDVNTNPNTLTSSNPNFIFTAALNQSVTNAVDYNEIGSYWAGHWTQSSSYIYSAVTFAYQFTNNNFNWWDPIYNNLGDYQYIINNADAKGQKELKGPAQIMKAYLMQIVVDHYGNAPYTDALKGVSSLTPKFDDQKAIYEDLIKVLDTAIANIKANPFTGALVGSDITTAGTLKGGSSTKWIKFANSLKLRILIRQSRVPGRDTYITTEIKKAVQEGTGFLDPGQDMAVNPGFVASDGKMNPFYERWGYNAAGAIKSLARYPRPTKYLFDRLIAANDTFRLKRLAYAKGGENGNNPGVSTQPEIVANYVGTPYGAPSGYTAPSTSYLGPSVIVKGSHNRALYLMTAAESQFLLAEAVERYGATLGLPNTSQQYYEAGVRDAFRLDGVPNAVTQANVVLTSGIAESDWTASPDKLKAIWFQKWLSLANFNGAEAWAEYRRTNYPNIPASAGAPVGQKPPVRLFYPLSELGSNQANVNAQGTIDVFNTRLFWDVD